MQSQQEHFRLERSILGRGGACSGSRAGALREPRPARPRTRSARPVGARGGLCVATRGARSPAQPRHARAARLAPGIRKLHLRAIPALHAAALGAEAGVGRGAGRPVRGRTLGGGRGGGRRVGSDASGPLHFSARAVAFQLQPSRPTVVLHPQPNLPQQPVFRGAARTSGDEAMMQSALFLPDSAFP